MSKQMNSWVGKDKNGKATKHAWLKLPAGGGETRKILSQRREQQIFKILPCFSEEIKGSQGRNTFENMTRWNLGKAK